MTARISDAWGIVGEVGGASRSDNDLDVDLDLRTFGGGARWSRRRMSRVVPLAQLVLGFARMGSSANIAGRDISVSQTKLMLQPGGGVNIPVGQGWGIVGQADYRRIFLDKGSGRRKSTASAAQPERLPLLDAVENRTVAA